jgi:hypothetical protein
LLSLPAIIFFFVPLQTRGLQSARKEARGGKKMFSSFDMQIFKNEMGKKTKIT